MAAPGEVFGSFRLVALLGRGGVAEVWKAEHGELGSLHAVKLLSIHSDALQQRLLAEGRAQATLDHPNIVRVTDIVRDQGTVGLVMELVEGPTLDRWIRANWSAERVESIFRGICAGVAAAHAAGLIHRDLKPANVLLAKVDGDLIAKVSDFGIVRALEGTQGTATGTLLGTLRFMSPEQLRDSSRVDARSDIWSLGCILYELLSRQHFAHDTDAVTQYGRLQAGEWRSLAELVPEAPKHLLWAAEAALRFNPEERPASMQAFFEILGPAESRRRPNTTTAMDRPNAVPGPGSPRGTGTNGSAAIGPRFGPVALDVRSGGTDDVQVWRGTFPSGEPSFVKFVPLNGDAHSLARVEREARLGKELRLTGIVPTQQVVSTAVFGYEAIGLIRPWISGPTLEQDATTHAYSPAQILQTTAELLGILDRLHSQTPPIVHRDVHPAHLILGQAGMVLVGLGRARDTLADPDFGGSTFVGALGYQAPEQIGGDAVSASDVYAAAAVAVYLFTRRDPGTLTDGVGRLHWENVVNVDDPIKALLTDMLAVEAGNRPTAAEAIRRVALLNARPVQTATRGSPEKPSLGTFAASPPAFAEPPLRPADPTFIPTTREGLVRSPGSRFPTRRALLFGAVGIAAGSAAASGVWAFALASAQTERAETPPTEEFGHRPAGFWLLQESACEREARESLCTGQSPIVDVQLPEPATRFDFEGDPDRWPVPGPELPTGAVQVDGPFGQSLSLPANHGAAIATGSPNAFYLSAWTASLWVRLEPTLGDDMAGLLAIGRGDPAYTGWLFAVDWKGYPHIEVNNGKLADATWAFAPKRLCRLRWTHLAASFAEGVVRTYVDGNAYGETAVSFDTVGYGDNPLIVGAGSRGGHRGMQGQLDQVALYPQALSDAQVHAAYAQERCASAL